MPKRYELDVHHEDGYEPDSSMVESRIGEYVEWSDYDELRKRYDALIAAVEKHWTDVWGSNVVKHDDDLRLYEVFEEMKK